MNKILLIDGNSFFYRSYYASRAIPNYCTHNPAKAVYTAIKMLKKFLSDQNKYVCIFVAFDLGKDTIRHQKFKNYKINRKKTPDDLIAQIPLFEEFLTILGVDFIKNNLYEADDLIASLCQLALKKHFAVDILSSDYDLLQLIKNNVRIFLPKRGVSRMDLVDDQNFFAKFRINPWQVVDFKSLTGDSSDNLPGVKGIGPKTAIKLLNEFSSLEKLYENLDKLAKDVEDKLVKAKTDAFFTKRMVEVESNVFSQFDLSKKKYDFNSPAARNFYKKNGMKSLLKNYQQQKFLL